MRYRTTEDGFVVYSVGRDATDDGGDEGGRPGFHDQRLSRRAKDIVFRKRRPKELKRQGEGHPNVP